MHKRFKLSDSMMINTEKYIPWTVWSGGNKKIKSILVAKEIFVFVFVPFAQFYVKMLPPNGLNSFYSYGGVGGGFLFGGGGDWTAVQYCSLNAPDSC